MTATNALTQTILEHLNRCGHFVWRQNQVKVRGRRFVGKKGVPDICGVSRTGRALFVEVKVGDDVQSEAQKLFQSDVTSRGAIYILARSMADVERAGL